MDDHGAHISLAARGMQKPELKSFKWARGARVALFRSKWTDVLTKLLASAMNMLGSVIQRCTNVGLKQAEKKQWRVASRRTQVTLGVKTLLWGSSCSDSTLVLQTDVEASKVECKYSLTKDEISPLDAFKWSVTHSNPCIFE